MRYSGIYFIPSHGNTIEASNTVLAAIVNSIESNFPHAVNQGDWKLIHRLFRFIPPLVTNEYVHLLHLSYVRPDRTWSYLAPPVQAAIKAEGTTANNSIKLEAASDATTPQPPQVSQGTQSAPGGTIIGIEAADTDVNTSQIVKSNLWTLRHAVEIPVAQAYKIGSYTVHLGALQAARLGPASSSNIISPGVLVCISTDAGDMPDEASPMDSKPAFASFDGFSPDEVAEVLDGAEDALRTFWNQIKKGVDLGKQEVQEFMMAKVPVKNRREEREALIRVWSDALKLRG